MYAHGGKDLIGPVFSPFFVSLGDREDGTPRPPEFDFDNGPRPCLCQALLDQFIVSLAHLGVEGITTLLYLRAVVCDFFHVDVLFIFIPAFPFDHFAPLWKENGTTRDRNWIVYRSKCSHCGADSGKECIVRLEAFHLPPELPTTILFSDSFIHELRFN